GDVSLDGTLTAQFSGFTPTATDTIFIVNNTGTGALNGTFSNFTNNGDVVANFGGTDWGIFYGTAADAYGGTNGNDVVIVPVPEPANMLAVCGVAVAVGGLAVRRLRRRFA